MISASHNPWSDNGVKVFGPGGRKLDDGAEGAIEAAIAAFVTEGLPTPPGGPAAITTATDPIDRYRQHLLDSVGVSFAGLRVVLDCANGAASELAPDVFDALGATVEVLNAEPDGRNINEGCGSTHPEVLADLMPDRAFDVGLAFDGDADRVIAIDEQGGIVDGDHIIGMCAIDRRDRGVLPHDTVVVTVMSNLGFRRGMARTGITVVETPVGDRNVLEVLDRDGYVLGGEQSGHVIFRDLASTGDGILTGLQLCDLLMRTGRYLSDQASIAMTRYPQVLRSVTVAGDARAVVDGLAGAIAEAERALGADGRVLVRPSGTEPLVRVMVEAASAESAEAIAEQLVAAVEHAAG
jgi:phosphoglucosamine mutase